MVEYVIHIESGITNKCQCECKNLEKHGCKKYYIWNTAKKKLWKW